MTKRLDLSNCQVRLFFINSLVVPKCLDNFLFARYLLLHLTVCLVLFVLWKACFLLFFYFVMCMLMCSLYNLDLEAFWSEEGLSGLPKGVIESLHKVTPANGLLSFERFVAGLKMCLLRYQVFRHLTPFVSLAIFLLFLYRLISRRLVLYCRRDHLLCLFSMWIMIPHPLCLWRHRLRFILEAQQPQCDQITQPCSIGQSACPS